VNAAIFEPIFKPGELPSLFQELKDFFADPDAKLLCLSLENVSFQYRTREILSNAIGRYLLELARLDAFVNMPVLAVLDEAHQFLAEPKKDDEYPLESFGLIAKEGRKYALTLCLATQRPRDIPEDVLSQVGMMIVHRITSDRDRTTIERAVGGFSDENAILLPQLETGQALVIGCEYAKPILIDMAAPEQKPDSGGPDYQRWW